MKERILVTGGSGLLGSHMLRWLLAHGYKNITATYQGNESVIPLDLKDNIDWKKLRLPDLTEVENVMRDKDWVLHAAALVSYHKEDKFKLLDINQKGTEQIVNAALAHNISHLIYVGSIGALGKEKNHVMLDEKSGWLQNEFSTSYGLSKYLGELEVWRGAAEGLNVSVVLPSVILGTGDWTRSSLQLVERVANKAPLYPGGQTGFVDVRDVVEFIGLLLEKKHTGERWLLNAANISYKDLYHQIATGLGLQRKYSPAPQWAARTRLFISNVLSGRFSSPELINQVYGTFSYDSSKSQGLEGFRYRPMEETIREVTGEFRKRGVRG